MIENIAHNEATRTLLEYWLSIPREQGKLCPYRTDFDMGAVLDISDQLFLNEWHNKEVICVVHSGEMLNKILGVNLTGSNLMLLLPEAEFPFENEYFCNLHQYSCAGYLTRTSTDIHGNRFIYRTVHLPLLGACGNIRFWIGTGSLVEGKKDLVQASQTKFADIQLLDREYFDIGAGIPAPAGTAGQAQSPRPAAE